MPTRPTPNFSHHAPDTSKCIMNIVSVNLSEPDSGIVRELFSELYTALKSKEVCDHIRGTTLFHPEYLSEALHYIEEEIDEYIRQLLGYITPDELIGIYGHLQRTAIRECNTKLKSA